VRQGIIAALICEYVEFHHESIKTKDAMHPLSIEQNWPPF